MNQTEFLTHISQIITGIFGFNYQTSQLKDLERRIFAVADELKIEQSIPAICAWLSKSEFTTIELQTLSSHLTVGETYFFREKPALELFVERIIPELIEQRRNKDRQIRIWSAGCSSGEEPYTLAILLKEHFPELTDWTIEIIATDISPVAIQKALTGEYTEWSFREINGYLKNKYFISEGKNWRITPEIKKMVQFSYLNLSKNSYPSIHTNTEEIDVVFCRNVMMYFTPEVIKEVSNRFKNSLLENGWLITSQVELNDEYFSNFERIHYRNGIFYQKTNQTRQPIRYQLEKIADHAPFQFKKRENKKVAVKTDIKITEQRIEKKLYLAKEPEKSYPTEKELESQFRKGNYQICIESCIHFISKEKLNNKIFTLLIKSYANSGQLIDNENYITKVISNNTTTPEMYYLYASLLNEKKEVEKTELMLKKAIYLDHKHVLSHLMLGEIFLKNEKKHLAVKHYGTVLEILGEYPMDEIVPESDGLTARSIKALTISIMNNL